MNLSAYSKLFLSVIVSLFLFFLFPLSVSAQTPDYTPQPVNNQNLSVLTQQVTINVLAAVSCQITGINPLEKNQACLGIDPKTHQLTYVQNGGGMIGVVGNLIAMTYTPPAHTRDFIAYMSSNFGVVKTAHAEAGQTTCPTSTGIGYCKLTPLINVWKVFRDLAFFVFTFVFTLIGVAVMLRIKIDPRTVMTLENQIPRVIIGLVLISFSFAIAGLLIDIMYVAIYVVFSFFSQPALYPDEYKKVMVERVADVQNTFQGDNPIGIFNNLVGTHQLPAAGIGAIVGDAAGGAGDIVGNIFYVQPNIASVSSFFSSGWFDLIRNLIGYLFSWLATIAVFLVLAIAVLVALFRVWFTLLYAYIHILLDVIISPIWIMAGVMPGSSMTFESWMRDMLANISAFPTVIAMFLIGRFFMYAFLYQGDKIFIAPLIGNPMRNNADVQPLSSLIAVGIVLMTPAAVSMTSEFFKAPSFKWTATAFQQVGAGAGVPGKIGSGGAQYLFGTNYDASGHGHGGPLAGKGGLSTALKVMGLIH